MAWIERPMVGSLLLSGLDSPGGMVIMKNWMNGTATTIFTVALALLLIGATNVEARVVLATRGPVYHRAPSTFEIILEGGLAEPMGDQSDDYWTTDNGFGSSTGYQFGARVRQYLGENFAISPVFQYTRFGTASGVTDYNGQANLAYSLRTSNYRYGLDFQAFMGGGSAPVRMFLTGGIALINDRYRDELQYNSSFEASVNTPAYSAGVGFKMKNIEVVGEYTYNRFDTNKFDFDGNNLTYNWDFLVVRVGLSFGR